MLCYLPPEEAIGMIGRAGFRFVEFGLTHERRFLEQAGGSKTEEARLERIRRAAEDAGVQIVQMHGPMFNVCAEDAAAGIAAAHRSLRRAARLGARWVVLHPGSAQGLTSDRERYEWTKQRNVEVFRDLLTTAEQVGVGIAIENMGGSEGPAFGTNVSELLWLVEALDSPYAGICWDTGHAHLAGLDQGLAIRAVGTYLVALHLSDNDGKKDQHWCPGRGSVDWHAVMGALRDVGYAGPLNLEVPGETWVTPRSAMPAKLQYLAAVCAALIADYDAGEGGS